MSYRSFGVLMSKRDYSKYDFTKFDYSKKWNLYIDADTIAYSCAAACSRDVCIVTHKPSGRKKEFENFDAFDDFLKNDEKGKNFNINEFIIPPIYFALSNVRNKVASIVDFDWVGDYKLYIQGSGNFRYDVYPEYKSNRGKKPALHKHCYDYMLRKYKGNIEVVTGYESEDFVIADANLDNLSVRAYIDKDLENHHGFFLNYNNLDLGVFYITPLQAFYNLCVQLIIGDSTDAIRGIDFISPELKEKFNIKVKSIGKKTAEKLLEDVSHSKLELKKRIVEIYKINYGDSWRDALTLTGKLVFITKERGVVFDVDLFTKGIEV